MGNQPTPYRVGVNVRDLLVHITDRSQVAIVAAAGLPETITHGTIRRRPHRLQHWMTLLAGPANHTLGNWLLDALQDRRHAGRIDRLQKKVHVLGHDHPSPQGEGILLAGPGNRFEQPLTCALQSQQRTPTPTGKRQIAAASKSFIADAMWTSRQRGHGHTINQLFHMCNGTMRSYHGLAAPDRGTRCLIRLSQGQGRYAELSRPGCARPWHLRQTVAPTYSAAAGAMEVMAWRTMFSMMRRAVGTS
jgi:hypothetical protein